MTENTISSDGDPIHPGKYECPKCKRVFAEYHNGCPANCGCSLKPVKVTL